MSGLKRAMMLCAIAAAMQDSNNMMYNRHHRSEPVSGEKYSKPKGQKYVYPDGFECYALNQKNADRKHEDWKP